MSNITTMSELEKELMSIYNIQSSITPEHLELIDGLATETMDGFIYGSSYNATVENNKVYMFNINDFFHKSIRHTIVGLELYATFSHSFIVDIDDFFMRLERPTVETIHSLGGFPIMRQLVLHYEKLFSTGRYPGVYLGYNGVNKVFIWKN